MRSSQAGKAPGFESGYRRFESYLLNHLIGDVRRFHCASASSIRALLSERSLQDAHARTYLLNHFIGEVRRFHVASASSIRSLLPERSLQDAHACTYLLNHREDNGWVAER